MVEALGLGMPQNAAIPAVDSRRNLLARMAGRRIVAMVADAAKAIRAILSAETGLDAFHQRLDRLSDKLEEALGVK